MSNEQETGQLKYLMTVIGGMVAFMVLISVLVVASSDEKGSNAVAAEPEKASSGQNPNIKPVGMVKVEGKAESAAEPAAAVADAAPAAPASPEETYKAVCAMCHATGAAGAPKVGDTAAWEARIAKGMDALITNANKGFAGSTGVMPAKGGRADLADDDVAAVVEFMVEQSQ